MQELQVLNLRNDITLDSRKIARMLEKNHKELLKDIRRYVHYIAEGNIAPGDFFLESQYLDKNNQKRPNYQITKRGCEFLAHKLTGQKGAIFTAKYINAFNELKENGSIQNNDIIQMLVVSQKNIVDMVNTLSKTMDMLSKNINMDNRAYETSNIKDISDNKELQELIENQRYKPKSKVLSLPQEIIDIVDILLSQEDRNFSYISRCVQSKGYSISNVALSNYYRNYFKGVR